MITAAAIRFEGLVWTLPRPARHHHIIQHIAEVTGATYVPGGKAQGFVDHMGRFVGRESAWGIARLCGQLKPRTPGGEYHTLFSEDVW